MKKKDWFEKFYFIYSTFILGGLMVVGVLDFSWRGACLTIYSIVLAYLEFHPEIFYMTRPKSGV